MRKLFLVGVAGVALLFAGCGEEITNIDGTGDYFVIDQDGSVDKRVIQESCGRENKRVAAIHYVNLEDGKAAIVECTE